MSKPPAFQFYASDFLSSTSEMTAEEVGVHIRLLCHQWIRGGIPNDDARLSAMAGQCQASAIAYAKERFRICDDGMLRHDRLELERKKQAEYRDKQAANGAKRWAGNAKLMPSLSDGNAKPMPTNEAWECSPSLSSSSSSSLSLSMTEDKGNILSGKRDSARRIIAHLNQKTGSGFRLVDSHLKLICCRLDEPEVTEEGIVVMIDRMVARWGSDPKMAEYLRPQTLFGKEKFSGYYDARNMPVITEARRNGGYAKGVDLDAGIGGLAEWDEQQRRALALDDMETNPFAVDGADAKAPNGG